MKGEVAGQGVVLVVDDDPVNVRLLADVLTGAGYTVRAAIRGEDALASAKLAPPDLILLDVNMPKMDGYEVCRRLKAEPGTAGVPILFVSALDEVPDKVAAFRAGGLDYLTKPFQAEEVLARVGTHVQLHRMQAELEQHNQQLEKLVQARTAEVEAANDELRERERLYRLFADNVSDVIWIIDADSQPTYYSPSVAVQWGYSGEEALRLPLQRLMPPESYAVASRTLKELAAAGRGARGPYNRVLEFEMLRRDGSTFWAETHVSLLQGESGDVQGFVGVTRDISKRKAAEAARQKLERQLVRTQKLEAIGTLAGGIAHDFNNLLSAIIGYTRMTLDDVAVEWEHREDLERVLRASERATDLVEQILAFSRQAKQEKRPFEPRLIVNEVLKLLTTLPKNIELRKRVETRAQVRGDPSGIHQVVMNLCTNAALALGDLGGEIEVSLSEEELGDVGSVPGLQPGSYVRLEVRDTGCGISREHVDQIFEPFFTTREEGKGTGLGLSVVHGIVADHGGAVTVDTELERGTRFRVYLPLLAGAPQPRSAGAEAAVPRGTEQILYVDDEEDLATLGKMMLEGLGYRVTAVGGGAEALSAFAEDPQKYDLVITDMAMPSMTGDLLGRRLRALRPGVPVLLCTGYRNEEVEAKADAAGVDGIVQKPIVAKALARKVREVLDARAGTA